jgi:hypothetical protein
MNGRLFALTAVAALALSRAAAAQPEEKARAAELFRRADQAAARGSAADAARLYAEAYAVAPHAITKYNEALEWDKAAERPRAADAYQAALEGRELDASRAADARARLTILRKQLGYVTLSAPAGGTVSVAHLTDAPVPSRVHLPPGQHEVRVRLGACERQQAVTVRAATTHDVALVCAGAPAIAPAVAAPPPVPRPDAPAPPPSTAMRDAGWVMAAVGAAGGVSLVPLGVLTVDANDRWKASGLTDEDAHGRAVSLRTATNVVLGVSAAVLVAGVTLVLLSPSTRVGASQLPRASRGAPFGSDLRLGL